MIILIPLPFFSSLYSICFHLNGVYLSFFAHKTHQTISSLRLWILFGDIQESTEWMNEWLSAMVTRYFDETFPIIYFLYSYDSVYKAQTKLEMSIVFIWKESKESTNQK